MQIVIAALCDDAQFDADARKLNLAGAGVHVLFVEGFPCQIEQKLALVFEFGPDETVQYPTFTLGIIRNGKPDLENYASMMLPAPIREPGTAPITMRKYEVIPLDQVLIHAYGEHFLVISGGAGEELARVRFYAVPPQP